MFRIEVLRTQEGFELDLPCMWQNLCAEADIYGARLMAVMNSE
jgi:hypothetical protein